MYEDLDIFNESCDDLYLEDHCLFNYQKTVIAPAAPLKLGERSHNFDKRN